MHNTKTRQLKRPHPRQLRAAFMTCAGSLALALGGASAASGHSPSAHAAKTLDGKATAHLHLVRPEGSQLIEEGPVSGALTGSAHADFQTGAQFTGIVTIHTHAGSITGRGRATPHGSGRYQSFSGSFTVTSGTGRYVHIHGKAGLYGVFDRRKESVLIQTTGTFSY
jgi:hypothetical protein